MLLHREEAPFTFLAFHYAPYFLNCYNKSYTLLIIYPFLINGGHFSENLLKVHFDLYARCYSIEIQSKLSSQDQFQHNLLSA